MATEETKEEYVQQIHDVKCFKVKKVNDNWINQTNAEPLYKFTTLENEPYVPENKKSICCMDCGKEFETYSKMHCHRGFPCKVNFDDGSEKIRMWFPEEHLEYVGEFLALKNWNIAEVTEDGTYIEIPFWAKDYCSKLLYNVEISKYNLEEWYEDIQKAEEKLNREITPETKIFEFSDEELKVLASVCGYAVLGDINPVLSSQQNRILTKIERRLKRELEAFPSEDGYFVKLSTRSPKDAVEVDPEEYKTRIERFQRYSELLCVKDSSELLLLMSKSKRILTDIAHYFKHKVFPLNFIVRRYQKNWSPIREFRCFVRSRKLTAITQYHCYGAFEWLQEEEVILQVRDSISQFYFEILQDTISKLSDYVFDVHIDSNHVVHLIELNPFGSHQSSGSGLYHWIRDRDLLYGNLSDDIFIKVVNMEDESN